MNILTFDTEEWYCEKMYDGDHSDRYAKFDYYLKAILDFLDEQNLKATFFCVGGLAMMHPEIIKEIATHGHEIGCHSNKHVWLSTFNIDELKADTETAIKSLEDVIGKKVVSYRAPAFSIGEQNKWALEVLAECGIERDASIYPARRDFGGFVGFPAKEPCIIKIGDTSIKEFPICLTKVFGKELAYSGGGYFRLFPLNFIKKTMQNAKYVMMYFHIADLMYRKLGLQDKVAFEKSYKVPGTLKNRTVRMFKESVGTKGAFNKMCELVRSYNYVNLDDANRSINWDAAPVIEL